MRAVMRFSGWFLEAGLLALARGAGLSVRALRAIAAALERGVTSARAWASALAADAAVWFRGTDIRFRFRRADLGTWIRRTGIGARIGRAGIGARRRRAGIEARRRRAGIEARRRRAGIEARIRNAAIGLRARRAFFALAAGRPGDRASRRPPLRSGEPLRPGGRPSSDEHPPSNPRPLSDGPLPSRRPALQRTGQGPSVRLTGRGAVVVVFGTCFVGLLVADLAHWEELADAVFFMASSLTAYYVRRGSLLPVAVSPPLLFFVAIALEKLVIVSGMLAAMEGTLVMLADAAPWLFAGTAVTVGIALLRGLRREVRTLVLELRGQ